MRVLKNVHLDIIEGSMNQAVLQIHHQSKNRLILILKFKRLFDTQYITQTLYKIDLSISGFQLQKRKFMDQQEEYCTHLQQHRRFTLVRAIYI